MEIKKSIENKKTPRIVFYGVAGIGKTTFASQFKNPIFLACEDGFGNLDVNYIEIKNFEKFVEALEFLKDKEFNTIVIDTLDALERLIFAHICKENKISSIEDMGFGKGYAVALNIWRNLLNLLDVYRQRNINIILLAHAAIKPHRSPDSDTYDRYRLDLNEKTASLIKEWADTVLFANYEVITSKEKGFGNGNRFLYTEERPAHWGKNRYGLPYKIEFSGCEQGFANFKSLMTASYQQKNEEKNNA